MYSFHFNTWQWLIIKHCKQRYIIILALDICRRFCFRISTIICAMYWTMRECSIALQSLLVLLSSLCLPSYLHFLFSFATFIKQYRMDFFCCCYCKVDILSHESMRLIICLYQDIIQSKLKYFHFSSVTSLDRFDGQYISELISFENIYVYIFLL